MIKLGKIVSTHGIKGEVKILSDFQFKKKAFKVGNTLLIDKKEYIIKSYRVHKNFDMVTLNDFTNINDVLYLMKKDVYIKEEDLHLDDNEVLDSSLLEFEVISQNEVKGKVLEVFKASSSNKILRVMLNKEYLIPFNSPMLVKIDKSNKKVYIDVSLF